MKFFAKRHGRMRTRAFKCVFLPLASLQFALSVPRDLVHAGGSLLLGKREKSAHRFRRALGGLSFMIWRWVRVALA
jgi:hypothetical protein